MKKPLLILIALAAVLFFFKLGSFSLYNAAETTYGEFIKQMRLTGDWITFHYNGQIIFDKPPLYYWLATITTYILGFNEFSIRFWAALCGVLTVITTYFLGKEFYNEKVGFYSGLIAMTAMQLLVQSRIAEIDILLTLLITASLLFFWQKKYLLMYLCMALALLVKGIIGIALPGFAVFLFLFFTKQLKQLLEMKIVPGILIILCVGTPWYIAEWLIHGGGFTQFALGFLFLSRFQGAVCGHAGPWYYYFFALMFGFFPWSHFIPLALIRTWKEKANKPELLTLCFILPVFIVFSVAKTKLPNYMLPIYPFLAIMVAKVWHDFLGNRDVQSQVSDSYKKGMILANIFLAVIVLLLIIAVIILGTSNYQGQYQELLPQIQVLCAIIIAGSFVSIMAFLFKKYKLSFYALPAITVLFTLYLIFVSLPAVEKYKGEKELGDLVKQNIKANEIIAAYETGNRPGVVFYNSKTILFLDTKEQLADFLKNKKGYCFTASTEFKDSPRVFAKQGDLIVLH